MDYNKKYLKYKTKYLKLKSILDKKNGFNMNGGAPNKKEIYLFKADWCPHCRNFKPTWDSLKNKLGKELNFITYDADKDKNEIKQFKIEGYPTIILLEGNKAIEYVGPRTEESLINFIKNPTNN